MSIDELIGEMQSFAWARHARHLWDFRKLPPTKSTPDGYLPLYTADEIRRVLESKLQESEKTLLQELLNCAESYAYLRTVVDDKDGLIGWLLMRYAKVMAVLSAESAQQEQKKS